MKELVIISGKGGTGKTSIAAALAVLAGRCVVADCDVDAADLHLVLKPTVLQAFHFRGGKRARISPEQCIGCGECAEHCRFNAISLHDAGSTSGSRTFRVDALACEGCGVCVPFCPQGAIAFAPVVGGEWFISQTRSGPMVHARLGPAQGNSGRLVSTVRQNARSIAEASGIDLVLIDGSPGIGCPVIASITGSSLVLAVTEPTPSGEHDLARILELTRHFRVPLQVCINKWDLNPEVSDRIEAQCRQQSIRVAGKIRYARVFTDAQIRGQTVVEAPATGAAEEIRSLWTVLRRELEQPVRDPSEVNYAGAIRCRTLN